MTFSWAPRIAFPTPLQFCDVRVKIIALFTVTGFALGVYRRLIDFGQVRELKGLQVVFY